MNVCEKCNGFTQLETHLDSSSYVYIDVHRCINCGQRKYPNFNPVLIEVTNICRGCGKTYTVTKLGKGRSKFCTRECNYIYYKNNGGVKDEINIRRSRI